jgi:hypothetical protein
VAGAQEGRGTRLERDDRDHKVEPCQDFECCGFALSLIGAVESSVCVCVCAFVRVCV